MITSSDIGNLPTRASSGPLKPRSTSLEAPFSTLPATGLSLPSLATVSKNGRSASRPSSPGRAPVKEDWTDADNAEQQAQIVLAPFRTLLGDGEAHNKFTRHQNVERYRRLLRTAIDKERRDYLSRLILKDQQKQKNAADSDYQY
jgi:hypothetical protein